MDMIIENIGSRNPTRHLSELPVALPVFEAYLFYWNEFHLDMFDDGRVN